MWTVRELSVESVSYDFTDAGLGRGRSNRVLADGVEIANLASTVDLDDVTTQVVVCTSCGYPGCAPGGWVSVRRLGEFALIIPAFSRMAGSEDELREYAPPPYLVERGVLLLGQDNYRVLGGMVERAPSLSAVAPLNGRDAARVVQWEAPGGVLGRMPDPVQPRAEEFLAFEGDLGKEGGLQLLDEAIRQLEGTTAVRLRSLQPQDAPVMAYLDLPRAPGWSPIVRVPGGARLRIGAEWILDWA